jgi:Papain family cysteine protease
VPQLPNVRQLRENIQRRQANWRPQEYPWIRELPEERLVNRLGARLDEQRLTEMHEHGEPDIGEVIRRFRSYTHPDGISPMSRQLTTATALTRPTSVDWRNRNGRSWITPVKDQGNCGSCVGFCCTALLESMVCIEHGLETDLSEADLFFCGGANCDGWNTDAGIDGIIYRGVSLEHCFLYRDTNMACNLCGSRNEEAIRASERRVFWNVESRKRYLADVGPMAAVFDVFDDFFLYSTGVYTHVSGEFVGRHCVLVVGYDDNQRCWICKNSWGLGWGESGFFRIGYGQCGIDAYTTFLGLQFGSPFWGVFGTRLPSRYRFRFFTGRFEGTGRTDVLAHCAASSDWWLGRKPGSQLQWSRCGNTRGFGNVDDGRPFWTGNFSGVSQSEVLFYYPGDHNWWLGQVSSGQLQWSLVGNTTRAFALA